MSFASRLSASKTLKLIAIPLLRTLLILTLCNCSRGVGNLLSSFDAFTIVMIVVSTVCTRLRLFGWYCLSLLPFTRASTTTSTSSCRKLSPRVSVTNARLGIAIAFGSFFRFGGRLFRSFAGRLLFGNRFTRAGFRAFLLRTLCTRGCLAPLTCRCCSDLSLVIVTHAFKTASQQNVTIEIVNKACQVGLRYLSTLTHNNVRARFVVFDSFKRLAS